MEAYVATLGLTVALLVIAVVGLGVLAYQQRLALHHLAQGVRLLAQAEEAKTGRHIRIDPTNPWWVPDEVAPEGEDIFSKEPGSAHPWMPFREPEEEVR